MSKQRHSKRDIISFTGEYYIIKGYEFEKNNRYWYSVSKGSNPVPYSEVFIGKFSDGFFRVGFQTKIEEGKSQWFIFTNIHADCIVPSDMNIGLRTYEPTEFISEWKQICMKTLGEYNKHNILKRIGKTYNYYKLDKEFDNMQF